MARRPNEPPREPELTSKQLRLRINQLKECIAELEAFDPQKVNKRYSEPEVKALEASIEEALAAAFGHATPTFGRYANAAKLDQGPHIMRTGGTWGGGHRVDYDVQDQADARRYLMEGKPRSIALLQSAIKALENRLKDFDFEAVVNRTGFAGDQ